MFGRIGKLLLTSLIVNVGTTLIGAGQQWLARKLQPKARPTEADAGDGQVVATPQGSIVTDGQGQVISFSAEAEGATKKAPEAPLQEA